MNPVLMPGEDAPHVCVNCDNAPPTKDATHCFECLRLMMIKAVAQLSYHEILEPEEAEELRARIQESFRN